MDRRLIPPEFIDALDHVLNKTGRFVGPVRQAVLWDRGTNLGEPGSPYPRCRPEEFDRRVPESFDMYGNRTENAPVYKDDQYVSYADWEGPEPGAEVRVVMRVWPTAQFQRSPTPEHEYGWERMPRASFEVWVKPRDGEPWNAGAFVSWLTPCKAESLRARRLHPVHPVAHELRAERWRSRDRFAGSIYAPPGVYC